LLGVGLARVLTGDTTKAKSAYDISSTCGAMPTQIVPILTQAKAEVDEVELTLRKPHGNGVVGVLRPDDATRRMRLGNGLCPEWRPTGSRR